ncbi:hypothetical protein ACFSTC_39030 [Nonomuraea ferruginea]
MQARIRTAMIVGMAMTVLAAVGVSVASAPPSPRRAGGHRHRLRARTTG